MMHKQRLDRMRSLRLDIRQRPTLHSVLLLDWRLWCKALQHLIAGQEAEVDVSITG